MERWRSRLGYVLALLGMAIGTGSLWRFPRLAAKYGGALIPIYIASLVTWSIPLLVAESVLGHLSRRGTVLTFSRMRPSFVGAWMLVVTSGIMFYYAVVMGWTLRYFIYAVTGAISPGVNGVELWSSFISSWEPVAMLLISWVITVAVIVAGVERGIERVCRVLLPTLFALLLILDAIALSLPGAWKGLQYMFSFDLSMLCRGDLWIDAVAQSAWTTGAGFGLALTYAAYAREREDINLNMTVTAVGVSIAALLSALCVIPTVYATAPALGIDPSQVMGQDNVGLIFEYLPMLFATIPFGAFAAAIFFLAAFFAALTSQIAMVEMVVRNYMDLTGATRARAVAVVAAVSIPVGVLSAVNLEFLTHQDFVWGIALIVSGLLLSIACVRYGVEKIASFADETSDIKLAPVTKVVIKVLVPVQAIALIAWWLNFSVTSVSEWWNPFKPYTLGSVAVFWSLALALAVAISDIARARK